MCFNDNNIKSVQSIGRQPDFATHDLCQLLHTFTGNRMDSARQLLLDALGREHLDAETDVS